MLAACGSSEERGSSSQSPASASPTVASEVLAATSAPSAPTPAPVTTPEPTTPEPTTPETTTPETTTPETTVPATTAPASALRADCLEGTWLLDAQATKDLHAALLPGFPVVVDGTHQLTFEGETVEYFINEVLRFQQPGVDLSAPFDSRSAGSYTIGSDPASGDIIMMDYITVEGGIPEVGGTVADSEGNLFDVLGDALGPDFTLPSIGGGPATCDGDVFTIVVTSGLASAVASFTRLSS